MIVLLYLFLAYLLYQFIFNLVIPVYRASRKIKKGFREMHNHMAEQMRQQQQASQPAQPQKPKVKAGEYIDFEEVK